MTELNSGDEVMINNAFRATFYYADKDPRRGIFELQDGTQWTIFSAEINSGWATVELIKPIQP